LVTGFASVPSVICTQTRRPTAGIGSTFISIGAHPSFWSKQFFVGAGLAQVV
jgi:hypothetical protein